jgi:hypothetical protein
MRYEECNRRELDRIRNPEREDREVVVDVVEHAKRSSDLRVKLTNHAREKDHGQPRTQEHVGKHVRIPRAWHPRGHGDV